MEINGFLGDLNNDECLLVGFYVLYANTLCMRLCHEMQHPVEFTMLHSE